MRTDHRPWPIPPKHWRMKQTWEKLLFAHWPIAIEELERLIPSPLKLDTYDGKAWIGVVPFYMSGIRLRNMPPVPFTSNFPELNVRTYVTMNNKPGVYFFSLDATNRIAVESAKRFYHLPYYLANMTLRNEGQKIHYQCNRRGSNDKFQFEGAFKPISEPFKAQQGTLDYWLTERYCLYSNHNQRVFRCDILHEPWSLQHAEADIQINTMANMNGLIVPNEEPLLHYSERLDVLTWGLEEVYSE